MSQYLIIFLIVAVFRGVVWVVQKVQQNAKAREALMAQQANASMGGPSAVGGVAGIGTQASSGTGALSAPSIAAEPAQAARAAQRGKASRTARGSAVSRRGAATQRGSIRPVASAQGAGGTMPGAWTTAAGPRRDLSSRPAQVRSLAPVGPPSSRAEAREARIGQSSSDIRRLLLDRTSLRQALLAREILGPPRGFGA